MTARGVVLLHGDSLLGHVLEFLFALALLGGLFYLMAKAVGI